MATSTDPSTAMEATTSPTIIAQEKLAYAQLAKNLATESSDTAIYMYLINSATGLTHTQIGHSRALAFLQAGGLSAVISHLCGRPLPPGASPDALMSRLLPLPAASEAGTVAADSLSCLKSFGSAVVLDRLLNVRQAMEELSADESTIPALVEAMGDAPHMPCRKVAATALFRMAQSGSSTAIAAAGVIDIVMGFYSLAGASRDEEEGLVRAGVALVCELVCRSEIAMRELQQQIQAPQASITFAALVLLQVRYSSNSTGIWLQHLHNAPELAHFPALSHCAGQAFQDDNYCVTSMMQKLLLWLPVRG
jgi:hypothetical protein